MNLSSPAYSLLAGIELKVNKIVYSRSLSLAATGLP